MNSLIVALIFTAFLYSSTQALSCDSGNPCDLGGYFTTQRGYQCIQNGDKALCTCPGGIEEDKPCRLCNRTSPIQNVCNNRTGQLFACIERDDYGSSYACACLDASGNLVFTSDADCDLGVTLTPRPTTTTISSVNPAGCSNGGVFYRGSCQCPSGFTGTLCTDKNDRDLCGRIMCKNGGVHAIRNPNGPYECVCLCKYGTYGEYCELTGTLGSCSASSCMNGGACIENVIGSTRHAYCRCAPGYNGVKCENRYFTCDRAGRFADTTMFDQGKYFECTPTGTTFRIEQKSCAKGLRFNANAGLCTY